MSEPRYLTLLLDDALDRPLDYEIPSPFIGILKPGMRALVPLRNRQVKGTIIELKKHPAIEKVQPILSLLEDEGTVTKDLFELAEWMSRYYVTPLRRVLRLILPSSVRGQGSEKHQAHVKRLKSPKELLAICQMLQQKHPAQAKVLEALLPHPHGLLLSELLEKTKVTKSPIETLAKKGLIAIEDVRVDRSPLEEFEFFPTKAKSLTPEQNSALERITASLGRFDVHLLHGITGSGKTEVYLQAIDTVLAKGESIILLVPEIALTAQTIERLKGRFQKKIAILHYRLNHGERHDAWHAIRRGEVPIVVGARSALFSPLPNLGMIIVDEEQENSYKQTDEMPCYHARDVAIMRCKLANIPCVLGSATPSLESYYNAMEKKYRLTTLKVRATKASLPKVTLIDLNREIEKEKKLPLIASPLLRAIEERFKKGEQTLLFLNRRGYHTTFLCTKCQESLKCPHCEISLTFHKGVNTLSCHLCDTTLSPPPRKCSKCHSEETMQFRGAGTEQVERTLHAIFPEIRTLRMDADTTRHKGSHDKLFKQFRSGKADVLIGTQMIAKGLHFPSVTLVGVLNTDSALNIPDFRASENVFQLLAQVAGRSGRGQLPGEVMIQTRLPDHPIITFASEERYEDFFELELTSREAFDYPPFKRLARFIFSGPDESHTLAFAETLHSFLRKNLSNDFLFLPVTPCGYAKIKDRYRFNFLIKGKHFLTLSTLRYPVPPRDVRYHIDIDPTTTFL